jgi:anti-sigma regulatory factor (Ser/Thr protein kinase)
MGCIIVPTAAKPWMYVWWTPVGSSQTRTEINVDNDQRLAAALSAVVEQSACRLGLNDDAQRKLQTAVQEAWKNVWRNLNGTSEKLHVDCEEFPDRIELWFRCAGGSIAEIEACVATLKPKVDHVSIETHSGKPQLKLVKYAAHRQ